MRFLFACFEIGPLNIHADKQTDGMSVGQTHTLILTADKFENALVFGSPFKTPETRFGRVCSLNRVSQ